MANTTSWVSQGISNYNGLEVDVRRQLSHGLQLRGVYTFASNLDDGSAWNTSVSANTPAFVMYPGNPGLDYGPAATNIRHAARDQWHLGVALQPRAAGKPGGKAVGWRLVAQRHRDPAERFPALAAAGLQPDRQRGYAQPGAPQPGSRFSVARSMPRQ